MLRNHVKTNPKEVSTYVGLVCVYICTFYIVPTCRSNCYLLHLYVHGFMSVIILRVIHVRTCTCRVLLCIATSAKAFTLIFINIF